MLRLTLKHCTPWSFDPHGPNEVLLGPLVWLTWKMMGELDRLIAYDSRTHDEFAHTRADVLYEGLQQSHPATIKYYARFFSQADRDLQISQFVQLEKEPTQEQLALIHFMAPSHHVWSWLLTSAMFNGWAKTVEFAYPFVRDMRLPRQVALQLGRKAMYEKALGMEKPTRRDGYLKEFIMAVRASHYFACSDLLRRMTPHGKSQETQRDYQVRIIGRALASGIASPDMQAWLKQQLNVLLSVTPCTVN
jgi:hypothetical protein